MVSSLSGVTRLDIERLRDIMQEKCFEYGEFTLSSGLPSKYYYDGKRVTLHSRWADLIGKILLDFILESGAEAVGGMALGAIPLAHAVSANALHLANQEIPVFVIRPSPKEHGTKDEVAASFSEHEAGNILRPGKKVAIVDDVVTTGGSIEKAIAVVDKRGCKVATIVALVERHEGGGDILRKRGYNFHRVFFTNSDGKLAIDESILTRYPEAPSARVLR